MIPIVLTIISLTLLFMVRNDIVYKAHMRALDVAHEKTKALIRARKHDYLKPLEEYMAFGSYDKMLFDLTKWRYRDFYPGWEP